MDQKQNAIIVGQPSRGDGGLKPKIAPSSPLQPVDIALNRRASFPVESPSLSFSAEKELVQACLAGNERARETLYHQYKRRVYGLATRIVGTRDAAEVAQEAFLRIYRGLPKFRGDSALGTWIYRLSVNTALSYVARRTKRREIAGEDLTEVPAPEVIRRDPKLAHKLEWALGQLSVGYRTILVLHDVEGLSHEECATILGCRVGTSKSQLHKARARMRSLLTPWLRPKESQGHD